MKQALKTRQICLFFIAFAPITKLFMLPSVVASLARNDGWITACINLALDLVTLFVINLVCAKNNLTFIQLLESAFGKIGGKVICFLYAVYFLLKGFMPLQEQKEFVKLSLYINLPTDLFFLPFFVLSSYLCLKPLRAIGRLADICWLFTLAGYLLLIFLSISGVDFGAIMPVGVNIKGAIKASYHSLNWWGDCVYLLFFMGNFARQKRASVKIILSYVLSGVIVIVAFIFFWGTFTYIAFRQKFAMTELSKYTTVINNVGRFDYVGILFILFSCTFSLTLPLYFCCRLLNYVFSWKSPWISPIITNGLSLFFTLFLHQRLSTTTFIFQRYFSLVFLVFSNILPLFTVFIKAKKHTDKGDCYEPNKT